MPESSKDHTRSVHPYLAILVAHEEEYRTTPSSKRHLVTAKIAEKITEAATAAGAKVAGDENLKKVRITAAFCQDRS